MPTSAVVSPLKLTALLRPPVHMALWQCHDVEGDGHCFYRCLARCLESEPDVLEKLEAAGADELQTVAALRYAVRQALRRRPRVQKWLADLLLLAKDAPCVLEDYPCLQTVDGLSVGDYIWKSDVWASAFEADVLRDVLRPHLIDLVITSSPDVDGVRDGKELKRQVHQALSRRRCTRTRRRSIVLVRLADEQHYIYLSKDGAGVIDNIDLVSDG